MRFHDFQTVRHSQIAAGIQTDLLYTGPGPPRGGATGAIFPGPHSARGPILINVTSVMQFSAIDSYPCMFILINKLHILTLQSLVHSIVY